MLLPDLCIYYGILTNFCEKAASTGEKCKRSNLMGCPLVSPRHSSNSNPFFIFSTSTLNTHDKNQKYVVDGDPNTLEITIYCKE